MDMRKKASLALAVLGTMGLFGCPKPDAGPVIPVTPGPGGSGPRMTIAVIPKGTENQFWQSIKAGADAAGKEENCDIKWDGPNPENDITAQVNIVNTMVNNKVNGIVIAACDKTALIAPIKKAMEAGIPVVTIDSGISTDDPVSYIATDIQKRMQYANAEHARFRSDACQ